MTPLTATDLISRAEALDAVDPLAHARDRFDLPLGVVYLDGNSLGAKPVTVGPAVADVLDRQWGTDLIASWTRNDWWQAPERFGERIAPMVGAAPGQVVVADSTTVNVFKQAVGGLRLRPGRSRIVADASTFPTNAYVVESAAELMGHTVHWVDPEGLGEVLDDDVALVMMNHVDYRMGTLRDMPALTTQAHACGALVQWDVCHSVGIMPIAFDALGVDLAVGCTYKYLNGGPGAPAFSYVNTQHIPAFAQPLSGWNGHADPFAMETSYRPDEGISRMRVGTPDIVSLLTAEAALEAFNGVDLGLARAKTQSLTELFIAAVDALVPSGVVEIVTPRDPVRRAGQVSVAHPEAGNLVEALARRGVITDFRRPDIVRFGFAPLYVRHGDAVTAALALADALEAVT